MSDRKKLSDLERYQVHVRAKAGESCTALGREFGINESSARRIKAQDTNDLYSKAGCPVEVAPEKQRIRVKAISKPLTVVPSVAQDTVPNVQNGGVPAVKKISLAPLGKQVVPVELKGIPRKLGKRQPTSDGAFIIMTSEGRAVKIEQCPIYKNFQMIRRADVDITKIEGIMVEGKVTQWSGEEIHGHLVFDGVPGSGIISRVEFHPHTLPGQYEMDREEFKRKLQ